MKRRIMALVLVVVLSLSLMACGTVQTDTTITDNDNSQEITETEETQEPEEPAEPAGIWTLEYYVDDFNQPTNEWYVTNNTMFLGTFSNSATTDSNLYAQIIVDFAGDVAIFLMEYGSHQVKNNGSYADAYSIKMKAADGSQYNIAGRINGGDDRIYIDDAYKSLVIQALKGNGNVSFYIENDERTINNYLFTAVTSNFSEVYAN